MSFVSQLRFHRVCGLLLAMPLLASCTHDDIAAQRSEADRDEDDDRGAKGDAEPESTEKSDADDDGPTRADAQPGQPDAQNDEVDAATVVDVCAGELSAVFASKQGDLYRLEVQSGKAAKQPRPACLEKVQLVSALAVARDGALWMIADNALHRIGADGTSCEVYGKLQANALALSPEQAGGPELLYALNGSELSVVDPKTSQQKPIMEVRANAIAGTSDGKLLTFEVNQSVLLVQLVDPLGRSIRGIEKPPAPKAYFAGGALVRSGLWFLFGETRYHYDEKLMLLNAEGPPLLAEFGVYLFAAPACEVYAR